MEIIKFTVVELAAKVREITNNWNIKECRIGTRTFNEFTVFNDTVLNERAEGRLDADAVVTITFEYNLNQVRVTRDSFQVIPDSALPYELQTYSNCCQLGIYTIFNQYEIVYNDSYFLRLAAFKGHTDIVSQLLLYLDPSADRSFALRTAAEQGSTEIVRLILGDGRADPSAARNYALRAAAAHGHIEIVEMLLPLVDPSMDDGIAINLALQNNHFDIAKLLLTSPRFDLDKVFDFAARFEMPSLIDARIAEAGSELLAKTFLKSCRNNASSIVNLLLQKGGLESNIKNQGLIAAVEGCATEAMVFLLYDEDVTSNYHNNLAIRIASASNCPGSVVILLQYDDTDPKVNDNEPLRNALRSGNDDVLEEIFEVVKGSMDPTTSLYRDISEKLAIGECVVCYTDVKLSKGLTCGHIICKVCLMQLRSLECPMCRKTVKGPLVTSEVLASIRQHSDEDMAAAEARAANTARLAAQGVNVNELYGL